MRNYVLFIFVDIFICSNYKEKIDLDLRTKIYASNEKTHFGVRKYYFDILNLL